MSGAVIDENQLMDFEVLLDSADNIYEANPVIYFVLNGTLAVSSPDVMLTLSKNDFIILNPFLPHSLKIGDESLVMRFLVNIKKLSLYCDIGKTEFAGNSVGEESGENLKLCDLLKKCVVSYYGKKAGNGRILLRLNSLYYEIAELLISSFSIAKNTTAAGSKKDLDESLIREMTSFVAANFNSPLKLQDLANHFYLSPAYISRFFKNKIGINFTKYLTDMRLDKAAKLLEQPGKTLTTIAMDCGFPNLAAFNTTFREKYHMGPKEYRASMTKALTEDAREKPGESRAKIKLLEYFEENKNLLDDNFAMTEQIETDASNYTILNKNWNKMINIGGAYLLLQKEMQDQVLFLCETLGFEYVRIWDLYEWRMHINVGNKNGEYNFDRLDACLDFLTAHKIKLYLELGFKPYILIKNYEHFLFEEQREIPFNEPKEYGNFVHRLLMHMVNRYGIQQVSGWIFEVWCDPRWFPGGDAEVYIAYFEQAYQAVKQITPTTKVGGAYDRSYQIISFDSFIRKWSARNIQPDFISIYCYAPLIRDATSEELDSNMSVLGTGSANELNLVDYVRMRKSILMRYGMRMSVYSSEWNFTVINANVMNDSRFKGAYIIKQLMDTFQDLDLTGYWFGTDLFVDEDEPPMLLNGRCGLITHQGICKPAYWAFWMMNHMEYFLLGKSDHVMVTMNEFDNYEIVCHNYKELDVQYYAQEERNVTIENIPLMYSDNKSLALKIRINGVRNGTYHIKTRSINSRYGCVQDEWMRLGKATNLTAADVEYLDHVSCPRIVISEQVVSDNTLYLTANLEPQEIQLIHGFRQMEE